MAQKVRSLEVTGGTLRPGDLFYSVVFGRVSGPHRVASLHANRAAGLGWVVDAAGVQYSRCEAHAGELAARRAAAAYLRGVLVGRMAAAEDCRRRLDEEERRLARLEGRPAEVS
jgi:hypothetical protein